MTNVKIEIYQQDKIKKYNMQYKWKSFKRGFRIKGKIPLKILKLIQKMGFEVKFIKKG